MFDKNEDDIIEFQQFEAAIRTIMMFEVYFDEMEGLFTHLDYKRTGKISKTELFYAIEKLDKTECELKLPSKPELEEICKGVEQEDDEYFTYEEYLNLLMNFQDDESEDDEDEN